MHDYIQQITLAKGSGEYCICTWTLQKTRDLELTYACVQLTYLHPVHTLASPWWTACMLSKSL